MDQIREAIFGAPMPVIVGVVIVALVLLWMTRKIIKWLVIVAVGAALVVGGLVAADVFVKTDREQMTETMEQILVNAKAADAEGIGPLLTSDFKGRVAGRTFFTGREVAVNGLKLSFVKFKFEEMDLKSLEIVMDSAGDASAEMKLYTRQPKGTMSGSGMPMTSRWELHFRKGDDGVWRLAVADLLEVNDQSAASITQFLPSF